MSHIEWRKGMRMALLLISCVLFANSTYAAPAVRDGDIIFHTSRSAQSAAIQRATHSPYSHFGIILYRDDKPFVFEAIDIKPDVRPLILKENAAKLLGLT